MVGAWLGHRVRVCRHRETVVGEVVVGIQAGGGTNALVTGRKGRESRPGTFMQCGEAATLGRSWSAPRRNEVGVPRSPWKKAEPADIDLGHVAVPARFG
jgi:hypothetical protein